MQPHSFAESGSPLRAIALPAAAMHREHGMAIRFSTFNRQHFWIPMAVFVLLSLLLMGAHGDQWLADRLYAMEGHAWALQSGHITQDVLHAAGRQATKIAWYFVLLLLLASLSRRSLAHWRLPLLYLLVSTLLATALVGWMKRWTHVDCPWDLIRYGGDKAYVGLFTALPAGMSRGGCFPAGHASAGYAWVALYFLLLRMRPQWRWWGLGIALTVGLVFGFAQQLRGAHFLSHDVWALMVCWLTSLGLYRLMLARTPRPLSLEQQP